MSVLFWALECQLSLDRSLVTRPGTECYLPESWRTLFTKKSACLSVLSTPFDKRVGVMSWTGSVTRPPYMYTTLKERIDNLDYDQDQIRVYIFMQTVDVIHIFTRDAGSGPCFRTITTTQAPSLVIFSTTRWCQIKLQALQVHCNLT